MFPETGKRKETEWGHWCPNSQDQLPEPGLPQGCAAQSSKPGERWPMLEPQISQSPQVRNRPRGREAPHASFTVIGQQGSRVVSGQDRGRRFHKKQAHVSCDSREPTVQRPSHSSHLHRHYSEATV